MCTHREANEKTTGTFFRQAGRGLLLGLILVHVLPASAEEAAPESVSAAPAGVSLQNAIRLAIASNLQTLLAVERSNEAGSDARQAMAPFLPNVSGNAYQVRSTTNLRAQGLDFPGLPSLVGPFNTFDARAKVTQTVFNLGAWRHRQAAELGVDLAHLQEKLAREQVASATTLAYVEALRARQTVTTAQANRELARSLKQLADDQHNVGVANGLDVARAATRLAQSDSALIQAQSGSQQADLQLQRLLGLPLGAPLVLVDGLRSSDTPPPAVDQAIAEANTGRFELRIAEQEVARSEYERRAAQAGHLPSVALTGDYGRSANTFNENDENTYRYGVSLDIPIFDGGLTNSRVDAAASRKSQAELQAADLKRQVEEDVRQSLVSLKAATDSLHAAQQTRDLAERELQLARDRFAAGAVDNIEVDHAQASLADARNDLVGALTSYNAARANLAAATGQAESFRL